MNLGIQSYCRITNNTVVINGEKIEIPRTDSPWLSDIYHTQNISYPKFFKMDNLAKAGFLGAELTLQHLDFDKVPPKNEIAVVCCNRSSSLDDDTTYQKTIQNSENYFPSPAVFVYTLANIVTGEISIRNKTMGESAFYIMESFNPHNFCTFVRGAFSDSSTKGCLCGWTEYFNGKCDVLFFYITTESFDLKQFTEENVSKLYFDFIS